MRGERLHRLAVRLAGGAAPAAGDGGTSQIGVMFDRITQFELWARRLTGGLFIAVSVYLSFRFILLAG